jgi:vacuolar-type H+-ATPase subunit I/STV1
MSLFALGAFLEFVMSLVTVTGPLFDLYYVLIGPQVGLLGAGVVYLLKPRLGKVVLYMVAALSVCLVLAVLAWPVDLTGLVTSTSGPEITIQQSFRSSVVDGISYAVAAFGQVPRGFTMILDTVGAILVVGGGILSFIIDRSRLYALIIAVGALMNAIGGILLGIVGYPDVFFYFEFLGIVLLFLGFLMSTNFVVRKESMTAGPR